MLFFFSGTDREGARGAMHTAIAHAGQGASVVRITDAHTPADLSAALQGGGMFGEKRVVVFENVLANPELAAKLVDELPHLAESSEPFFLFEEKPDAATRKRIEKHAEKSERFDAAKAGRDTAVFDLAYAMQRGDKKNLWVGYMREISKGSAPEMIHGILFWAAKSQLLKSGNNAAARERAKRLVVALAELPHEARRRGFDMEYALERFVLSIA